MKTTHRTTLLMAKLVAVIALIVLAGCGGGATFTQGGLDPLKGSEKVGIIVTSYQIMTHGKWIHGDHVSDKVDAEATKMAAPLLMARLVEKGFTPVLIPATAQSAELIQKYRDLPRNFRRVVSEPDSANLGDLHDLFRENGIDCLILFEGESTLPTSALNSFTSAALSTGISMAIGSVVPGNYAPPVTFTYTGVVGSDGKFSFYNREQFTKHGDFTYLPDRTKIVEHAIDGWVESRK